MTESKKDTTNMFWLLSLAQTRLFYIVVVILGFIVAVNLLSVVVDPNSFYHTKTWGTGLIWLGFSGVLGVTLWRTVIIKDKMRKVLPENTNEKFLENVLDDLLVTRHYRLYKKFNLLRWVFVGGAFSFSYFWVVGLKGDTTTGVEDLTPLYAVLGVLVVGFLFNMVAVKIKPSEQQVSRTEQ